MNCSQALNPNQPNKGAIDRTFWTIPFSTRYMLLATPFSTRYMLLAIPFSTRYMFLAIPFSKRYIYEWKPNANNRNDRFDSR